ncbi:dynamin family protein [Fundidesulfovibrio soli]|uniref:dynamin family protein n=1 Tax=Fundidesulfovibrio soli TaxID=2922716 RepID=UPI001FAE7EB4|nr:dynamin family protein [Fundidesulfovibrio soli]
MKAWREACLDLEKETAKLKLLYQFFCDYSAKKATYSNLVSDSRWSEALNALESRIKDRLFKIAVVGMEKAGKSTFINAWLGDEILPYAPERCTYTTTNIISVDSDDKQALCVNFHTRESFEEMVQNLTCESGTETDEQRRALSDLNNINTYNKSIHEQLKLAEASNFSWRYGFTNLSSIKDQLSKYVSNPEYIYAVRGVTLYTSRLIQVHDVAFYDVPGLNSGLRRHQQETKDILNDCDAIIIVQDIERPSLTDSEKRIIQYATEKVYGSSISDKAFVFLSKTDKIRSGSVLRSNLGIAKQQWLELARIPDNKIFFGSPGAHLILNTNASEDLIEQVGSKDKIAHFVNYLSDESGFSKEEILGVSRSVERINNFVLNEATQNLKQYFNTIKSTLVAEVSAAIIDGARDAESAELVSLTDEAHYKSLLKAHMMNVIRALDAKLLSDLNGSAGDDSFTARVSKSMHSALINLVESNPLFAEFSSQKACITNILLSLELAKSSPGLSNEVVRQAVYRTVLSEMENIAYKLSSRLGDEIDLLLSRRQGELYDLIDLRRAIENNYKISITKELAVAFRCLFMRYGKMLMDLFLLYPLGNEQRENFAKYESDLSAFESYIVGIEVDNSLDFKKIRSRIRPGKGNLSSGSNNDDSVSGAIFEEILNDLNAFKYYISYPNFYASGFTAFIDIELNSLCAKLTDDRVRDAICLRFIDSVYSNEPAVISQLPKELKDSMHRASEALASYNAMCEFYDQNYIG